MNKDKKVIKLKQLQNMACFYALVKVSFAKEILSGFIRGGRKRGSPPYGDYEFDYDYDYEHHYDFVGGSRAERLPSTRVVYSEVHHAQAVRGIRAANGV